MSAVTLCIFARAPVRGHVKSRLAADLGDDAALNIHRELVEGTLARLADLDDVHRELWLDDIGDAGGIEWARRWHLPLHQQSTAGNLGARMHDALLHAVGAGGLGIVIGTDCPGIDQHYVRRAVAALASHDLVLGPAADGGYVLVGARRAVPEIFRGIDWGTGSVLAATLEAAASAKRTVVLLEEVEDVDTAADWYRYLQRRDGIA